MSELFSPCKTLRATLLLSISVLSSVYAQKKTYLNVDLFNTILLKPVVGVEHVTGKNSYGARLIYRYWDIGQNCDRVLPVKKPSIGSNVFYRFGFDRLPAVYLETLLDFRYHYDPDFKSCLETYNYSGKRKELSYKSGIKGGWRFNLNQKRTFIDLSAGLGVGFRNTWDTVEKAFPGFSNGMSDEENFRNIKRIVEKGNGSFQAVFTPYFQVNLNQQIGRG